MGALVLDVLTKQNNLPVAQARVSGISHLSLSHEVSGLYTLVSPTSEKLGELQVGENKLKLLWMVKLLADFD